MGFEHFYWFIDRAVVDPLLQMRWTDFLRKYPWNRADVDELIAFAVDPEPTPATIAEVLAKRSLRWTMKRTTPAYYFLNVVVDHIPSMSRRCPEVWVDDDKDVSAIQGAAVEGYLNGQIDERVLWAVHNIDGSEDPRRRLRLSRKELVRVESAIGYGAREKPIFPWQTDKCLEDGYRCLRAADTARFIKFIVQAWTENWRVPRLKYEVVLKGNSSDPRFRDFELAKQIVASVKNVRFKRPSALRYFG